MNKQVILIVVLCLYVNTKAYQSPYDLEDEVKEQLEELRVLVRSEIFTAMLTIADYVSEVYSYRDNCLDEADLNIQQEYQTLNSQINTLQDLAQSAGQNVDVCTATNGPLLEQLPYTIIDSLLECVASTNMELSILDNESRYRIDILINEVHIFDYEIVVCAGDILCMAPLVQRMELAKVSIPQKIGVELERTRSDADKLKLLIKQCTDSKVAQFVTEGTIIFNDIADCINNLLS